MSNGQANHEQRVRISAYHFWEADGRPDGQEGDHWERAEKLCECGTIERIQGAGLLLNNSKLLTAFRNTTGEPDAPRHLSYKLVSAQPG